MTMLIFRYTLNTDSKYQLVFAFRLYFKDCNISTTGEKLVSSKTLT